MNKLIRAVLCLVLLLGLPQTVAATETDCRITGNAVKTMPGKTVEVLIDISGNPGFTNFGIALEYDSSKLELLELVTAGEEGSYLCGSRVSTNTVWTAQSGDGTPQGYVTAAVSEKITISGTLFAARFAVKADFEGTTWVIPHVYSLRCYEDAAGFSDVAVTAEPVKVAALTMGDINQDGIIEYDDVISVYSAAMGEEELTPEEMEIVDMDGSGRIEKKDAEAIYDLYTGNNGGE